MWAGEEAGVGARPEQQGSGRQGALGEEAHVDETWIGINKSGARITGK